MKKEAMTPPQQFSKVYLLEIGNAIFPDCEKFFSSWISTLFPNKKFNKVFGTQGSITYSYSTYNFTIQIAISIKQDKYLLRRTYSTEDNIFKEKENASAFLLQIISCDPCVSYVTDKKQTDNSIPFENGVITNLIIKKPDLPKEDFSINSIFAQQYTMNFLCNYLQEYLPQIEEHCINNANEYFEKHDKAFYANPNLIIGTPSKCVITLASKQGKKYISVSLRLIVNYTKSYTIKEDTRMRISAENRFGDFNEIAVNPLALAMGI